MEQTGFYLTRRNKWLLGVLVPATLLAGTSLWLLATTSGLRWLIGIAERQSGGSMAVQGVQGALLQAVDMERLDLRGDGWRMVLHGVQVQWRSSALWRGRLDILHLTVQQAEVWSWSTSQPAQLPDNLRLPLAVEVAQIDVLQLHVFNGKHTTSPAWQAGGIQAHYRGDAQRHELAIERLHLAEGVVSARMQLAAQRPFVLQAQGKGDLTLPGRAGPLHWSANAGGDLQQFELQLAGGAEQMKIAAAATLTPYANNPVTRASVDFNAADPRLFDAAAPAARLSGRVELRGGKDGLLEGTLHLSNSAATSLDQNGLPLLSAVAHLHLFPARWQVTQLHLTLEHGGDASGELEWQPEKDAGTAQLTVQGLDPAALDGRLPQMSLQGSIALQGGGKQQRAVLELADARYALHAELLRQGAQLELSGLRLTHGDTVLEGQGHLAFDRRRTFRLASRLRKLNLAEYVATPPTDLNAVLEISGALLPEPQGALRFDLSDSRFGGYAIGGNGNLEFAGTHRLAGTMQALLGDNHLSLDVAQGTAADHLRFVLDAPRLEQLGSGMGGQLAGEAVLTGAQDAPAWRFSVSGKELQFSGHSVELFNAAGVLGEQALELRGDLSGYHRPGGMAVQRAQLELHGARAQHKLDMAAQIAQGNEAVEQVNLSAQGGFSVPSGNWKELQWRGEIGRFDGAGAIAFRLLAAAPLGLSAHAATLGGAHLLIGGGQVHLAETQWTPQRWRSSGSFDGIGVRAMNLAHAGVATEALASMRFGGRWAVDRDAHWRGDLQMWRESGDWLADAQAGTGLGLHRLRLSARCEHDLLETALDASGERLGELAAKVAVPLTQAGEAWRIAPEAPLAGHVHLEAPDISWLGPMLDGNLQSAGQLGVDADVTGTFLTPRLRGAVQGKGLMLALLDQGVRLEQGSLSLRLDERSLYVDTLSFVAPYQAAPEDRLLGDFRLPGNAGSLSASGRIDLEGGDGDLRIVADKVPLAQRADRWVVVSGAGHARYAQHALQLGGDIHADAGLINQPVSDRPRWSHDVQIVGQEKAVRGGTENAVNATFDLGEHFFLRASGLEARLAGKLEMHGDPGEKIRVVGIIAAQDAVFDAYGQRLQVERGLVNFNGPLDDPGLNILALRKGLSVEAGVEIGGTARNPQVHLVSTPNVPDAEKLSWIVLGRVPDSNGIDSSLLLAAAGNIMGGSSAGQLGRALGVDELSLQQQAGTGDPLANQKLTVGKRLSRRAYLSYEQGLSDVSGVTKLTYTLTPRITLVTRTGLEDALDLVYSFRFY